MNKQGEVKVQRNIVTNETNQQKYKMISRKKERKNDRKKEKRGERKSWKKKRGNVKDRFVMVIRKYFLSWLKNHMSKHTDN